MIKIICIGKIKEKYLLDGITDYLTRLNKYHKVTLLELKDSNIQEECKLILNHINKNDYIISMCIEGIKLSTIELKNKIDTLLTNGTSSITIIMGGSDGLSKEIKERSNLLLSFSDLTFPHGLFRIILLEQLYRVFKIMNNETYHK